VPAKEDGVGVTVEFEWRDFGEVRLEGDGMDFSALPTEPGLYRYRLVLGDGASAYVGEAANLRRRAYGYQLGYKGQKTNFRMNARMREHLAAGGRIEMAIATEATIELEGRPQPLDLRRKASRLLVENAAIHAVPDVEPLENLPGIGDTSD
jgi:hypothetical protein